MKRRIFVSCLATFVIILALGAAPLSAQAPSSTAQPASSNKTPPFKPEELEQIVAPIALYPDSLLAQIFMASTYPLEIVEAARWSKEHPDVKGDAVSKAVESQTWDASVKSLIVLPDVLAMMNEKLDWTQKLGDAFLAQQKEVMDAVQRLRAKAKEAGNLKSSKEQTVKTEPAPAGSATPQTIIIEQADPQVVYVPTYNPTVVYGAWAYPAYPPYYYYPPGYAAGAAFWSFTAGVIVGGAIWGNCNWGGSDIDIDVNKYNNFNRNEINANRNNVGSGNRGNTKNTWQHNPEHRQGVGYRDSASQQKYGRASSQQSMQSREQYRGRAEQGRQEMAREGGAANQRDLSGNPIGGRDSSGQGSQSRDSLGGGDRSAQSRDMGGQSRDMGGQSRGSSSRSSGSSSAFGGGSGASTRASSSRGMSSRSAGGMSRGGGGRRR
jgi:hypothetical protein